MILRFLFTLFFLFGLIFKRTVLVLLLLVYVPIYGNETERKEGMKIFSTLSLVLLLCIDVLTPCRIPVLPINTVLIWSLSPKFRIKSHQGTRCQYCTKDCRHCHTTLLPPHCQHQSRARASFTRLRLTLNHISKYSGVTSSNWNILNHCQALINQLRP